MAAANLKVAAQQAFPNLDTLWLANTMKTKIAQFCAAALPIFLDQDVNSRPITDWVTLLYSSEEQMPNATVSFFSLVAAADQLYRLCWIAYYLANAGIINNTQATALLAAYNAAFT